VRSPKNIEQDIAEYAGRQHGIGVAINIVLARFAGRQVEAIARALFDLHAYYGGQEADFRRELSDAIVKELSTNEKGESQPCD